MIINMAEQEKQLDPALHAPHLDRREEQMAEERSSVGAHIIHEVVRKEGEEELNRTTSALAWSGLAAGLSMGFSLLSEGLIYSMLPDAPWRSLLSKFGYTVGFVVVVLGRQHLFTENTLTPIIPLLARRDASTFKNVLRLWGVVLAANLVGTFVFAWVLASSDVFSPELRHSVSEIGENAIAGSFVTIVVKGLFAGWLIALMVWLLAGVKSGSVSIIIVITYVVGLGGFAHIITGSLEAFYLVITGAQSLTRIIFGFMFPTLLGNILGGVSLVAALNHAQVVAGGGKK
jgi:formate/nitrite transporter FocA (FNT family)